MLFAINDFGKNLSILSKSCTKSAIEIVIFCVVQEDIKKKENKEDKINRVFLLCQNLEE